MRPFLLTVYLLTVVVWVFAIPVHANNEAAMKLVEQAADVNKGFGGATSHMQMIIGSNSRRVQREYILALREGQRCNDTALIRFTKPSSIKDTKMLSVAYEKEDNQQWLYLPSMKRNRKIAQNTISSSFVGSDFSFEDISPMSIYKYRYPISPTYMDYEVNGVKMATFRVQRVPLYENSAYDEQQVYLDTERFLVLAVEGFKNSNLIKKVTFSDYKQYGEYWWPSQVEINDLQKGSFTQLITDQVAFGSDTISAVSFSDTSLNR